MCMTKNDVLRNTFPDKYSAPIYLFIPHKMMSPAAYGDYPLHRAIQHKIIDYLNSRSYGPLETWEGIQSESLRIKSQELFEKLKEKNSDNEAYLELCEEFEKQIKHNTEELSRISAENQKLKIENSNLNYWLDEARKDGSPIIVKGTEDDKYPDEQKEIIIEILSSYLEKSIEDSCRRADIIKSIIKANPTEGIPEQYRQIIKNAFDGYTKFDCSKIRNALKETGINIIEHTGHYKVQFHDDARYTFEAAATPSDHRAGKNAASIINKLMF